MSTRGRNAYPDERVTTVIDGDGIFQATIEFPVPGYEDRVLRSHEDRLRAKARRAIQRAVARRDGEQTLAVRVKRISADKDASGLTRSVTFREQTSD